MRKSRSWLLVAICIVILAGLVPAWNNTAYAAAPEGFASPQIRAVWQRDDGQVASGAVQRPWLWGPGPFHTDYEPYAEAPQGNHLVQYFDKGRLEINNANGDKTSPWFVTSGLLVKEMVNGAAQVGDHDLYRIGPANVPVAGDEGAQSAATYASFSSLTGRVPAGYGQLITQQIDATGRVSNLQTPPSQVSASRYESASGHNWASVFWAFATSPNRPAHFDWLPTLGYPITEPYWTRTTINGQPGTVLVQLFERRTLTFNPANPAASQVEMGNVGRHYYNWRYRSLNTVDPNAKYTVQISVGKAPRRTTTVSETLVFTNNTGKPLNNAVLRSIWNNWDGVFSLDSAAVDGTSVAVGKDTTWENGVNLSVRFPAPLQPGRQTSITLEFTLTPRPVGGRSGYDRSNDILCLGDMLPTLVPFENGGWAAYPYSDLGDHGYYLTSSYSVEVDSASGESLIVGGTGKLTSVDSGHTCWHFSAPNVRDVAYVLSPRFMNPYGDSSLTRQQNGVTVHAFFLPSHAAQAQRQLALVLPAFAWFSQTVGEYPFDTFTIAEMGVPLERTDDYAQEYPTCYFMPTNWLSLGTPAGSWTWYNPVHETGHQWFYSTVGNNQLTDPWLDEAMTSEMTAEYVRVNFPDSYSAVWSSTTAGAGANKPVSSGVFSGFATENEYTYTVYDKAVVMLDRVRKTMGTGQFYAAIRDYYSKFKLKQATPADLTGILQPHSSVDLGAIFSAYLGY